MNESEALYQDAIKQYARAGHGHGSLAAATGEARMDNPLCGDRVRMQVAIEGGRVAAVAHETRGCLLCRAAASLLGARAAGLDGAAVAALGGTVDAMLKGAAVPQAWPELEMFTPARAFPSRHRCILLPFRALAAAMGNVPEGTQRAGAGGAANPASETGGAGNVG